MDSGITGEPGKALHRNRDRICRGRERYFLRYRSHHLQAINGYKLAGFERCESVATGVEINSSTEDKESDEHPKSVRLPYR
jgi:hypothetical protein